ncbi:MAG: hypothetical protein A3C06_02815 [Candidatus Taylorbacteria bacterium RIFCSPHIGHO2_02_FULL_46_13]|uniref:Uncharacterized protein n=1 Tax=Candidatus Taylorbacteria bacterium RIFCSPHIGHO2_02_FULL_46_13 TaxID=1802312 RepID=A0A1G2MRW8_9BACT|nr:MAG: hypothetical protein A3C06_02815 [Candidatus Taylorbacteria bacterium RIFCSPHIGHO2_02_FULL_46_13]
MLYSIKLDGDLNPTLRYIHPVKETTMSHILLRHQSGLGDHIICHGIIREYCKKYEKVSLFSTPQNYPSISFMYHDLKNLEIIAKDEALVKEFIALNGSRYDEVKIIGFQYLDRQSGTPFEKQFYDIAGVAFTKKWDSFFVERDLQKETAFFNQVAPNSEYLFLHEDAPRNYRIERKFIDKKYRTFSPDPALTKNIFDYCTIIERAKEIHVIDSSFMFLVDCLSYENPKQKLYVHRYARENETWKLPILKKNWNILTLTDTQAKKNTSISVLLDKTEDLFLGHPLFKRITRKLYRTLGWRTRLQKRGSS